MYLRGAAYREKKLILLRIVDKIRLGFGLELGLGLGFGFELELGFGLGFCIGFLMAEMGWCLQETGGIVAWTETQFEACG